MSNFGSIIANLRFLKIDLRSITAVFSKMPKRPRMGRVYRQVSFVSKILVESKFGKNLWIIKEMSSWMPTFIQKVRVNEYLFPPFQKKLSS